LKIDTQILEDHHAQLTVEVEPERLEAMKRRAAAQIARRIKIPGFRPGKAPYAVILRQVGENAVLEQAVELIVDEIYPEVIKQAEIKPYGPGQLEKVAQTDPLTLEFKVPLDAEVILGDYNAIRRLYEVPTIPDTDVEKVIQDLREHQAIAEPVERPVQEGDLVSVIIYAERKQAEDTERVLIRDHSQEVVVLPAAESASQDEGQDEERDLETPFPGFSRYLIGMSAGEEKTFSYTFADDYLSKALQGVEAEFKVTVESVKSRSLPAIDDEFAASVGDYADLEALRSGIRKSLELRALDSYNAGYDEEILKEAVAQTTYKYPTEMLDHEMDLVLNDLKRRLGRQGVELETYLKIRQIEMEDLRNEMLPVAEERLKRELFISTLAKAENVEVESEALEKEATETMSYLYQTLPEGEARKLSNRDVYTNIVTNVMVDMLSRKTMELFRNRCAGKVELSTAEQQLGEEISQEQQVEVAPAQADNMPAEEASQPVVPQTVSPEEEQGGGV
jgi:trigger factor